MSQYIDRKEAAKTYRPKAGSMSPGLKRAREPYRLKNAIMGLTLGAFAVAIWAYSINAVKQDVFDDVDEETRAMATVPTTSPLETGSDLGVGAHVGPEIIEATKSRAVSPTLIQNSVILEEVAKAETQSKGVLHHLDKRIPWLLDPKRKTLVWGAPPVDDFGKIRKL
ncbi:hypothetical protein BYT27DRAFT_7103303 [Phlegmacium glaucopus]|nr:hypothetical protein BYT27DRAFT_7103303 [Phlegmacium glaucopus]